MPPCYLLPSETLQGLHHLLVLHHSASSATVLVLMTLVYPSVQAVLHPS